VIKSAADSQNMTVAFLSRPLSRHVQQTTSEQTSFTDPKKRYYASPDAAAGEIAQTTLGERGFSVTVARKVVGDDGKLIREDSFSSRYIPEDAIYLVGKGATLPAGQTLAGLYPGYTGSSAGVDLAHWLGTPPPPKKKKAPAKPGAQPPTVRSPVSPLDGDARRRRYLATRRRPRRRRRARDPVPRAAYEPRADPDLPSA
jgi:hypothetical protein